MAAPTLTQTFANLRVRISRRLNDVFSGTASGGSATTLTSIASDLARLPTTPAYLLGAELSTIGGTGSGQTRLVTTHAFSTPTTTLTVLSWTAVDSTTTYEIHNIGGRGFLKLQYDNAINNAIDSLADAYFTDTDNVYFGAEGGSLGSFHRHEYPMPTGFNYLYGVDFLNVGRATGVSAAEMDTFRAMGDATARTRLFQGFQVPETGWYEWVVLYLEKVGSPTGNLSVAIHTNSAGLPSGTTVTNGTSDNFDGSTVDAEVRYIPFRFSPPIFLSSATQYHIVLIRSNAVSATDYWRWAEDDDNTYGDGTAGTYDATTYTAVSGSDFIFSVFPRSSDWVSLRKDRWAYKKVGSDFIYIPSIPNEGTPIRLRGAAAIAEVSTETTNVPVRPEYVEAFVIRELLAGRSDNVGAKLWAEQLLLRPRPFRPLPPNTVRVYG